MILIWPLCISHRPFVPNAKHYWDLPHLSLYGIIRTIYPISRCRGVSRRSHTLGARWVINFGALERSWRMSPSTLPFPHQFGTPEVFFPGAPACAWMAGADSKIKKKKEWPPKSVTNRTSAPMGTEGIWGGCAHSEVEEKCNFQSQFSQFGDFFPENGANQLTLAWLDLCSIW